MFVCILTGVCILFYTFLIAGVMWVIMETKANQYKSRAEKAEADAKHQQHRADGLEKMNRNLLREKIQLENMLNTGVCEPVSATEPELDMNNPYTSENVSVPTSWLEKLYNLEDNR